MISVLFVGDVVGKVGRKALGITLPRVKRELSVGLTIVNGENSAGGAGITPDTAEEIFQAGADIITSGDHTWDRKEYEQFLTKNSQKVIRPLNYPKGAPGVGFIKKQIKDGLCVGMTTILGRVFMRDAVECPFKTVDNLLASEFSGDNLDIVLVEIHAEATSEKAALAHYLDGRVAAVLGTHTHVQTADERILKKGTAFISDVGMCGPSDSVIGVEKESVIKRFISARPLKFDAVEKGPAVVNGVIVCINEKTKRVEEIRRIAEFVN